MHTITSHSPHCIEVCNNLLQGELSAIETYNKAIEKFADEPEIDQLREIRNEHTQSAVRLRENIVGMGGTPERESGAWGAFAKSVQATADFFGENSALWALRQGEEYGRGLYESALEDPNVMDDCKHMIRTELFPRLDRHVVKLSVLSDRV